jgi:hypothetical protein
MPNQKVTIAKVAGESGKKLWLDFSRFIKNGRIDPEEHDGIQIPTVAHQKQILRLIDALRQNNSQPPIIFYSEYIDFWSNGYNFDEIFPKIQSNLCQFWFKSTAICGYLLPDEDQLLNKLKKCSSSRNKSILQESKWYWTILRHAVQAWDPLVTNATLIVIREVLGGLVEDEEIEKSLTTIPEWLNEASSS